MTDARLLSRVARQDYDAFAELYDRYERRAYALARRVVRDPSLAEDVVIESMLTVWRRAGEFAAARGTVASWILTIVHRRAVDAVRAEARRRRVPEVSEAREAAPGADEAAVLAAERAAVQQALTQLPARERELLELAYYGGMTQSELAGALDLSIGTVKSRMFSGLRRLAGLLDDLRDAPLELELEPA